MIGAFNSVYAALQGFFSRSFWFSAFLPVTLFAVLHVIIAGYVFGFIGLLGAALGFHNKASDVASTASVAIIALVVIAYALVPLLPRFRGLLDGSLLPAFLHDWLRAGRLVEAQATLAALKVSRDEVSALERMNEDAHADNGELRTAYRLAMTRSTATATNEITEARTALQNLENALSSAKPLKANAEEAQTAALAALAKNNPNSKKLKVLGGNAIGDEQVRIANSTNDIADDLEDLLVRSFREALYRHQVLRTRNRVVGALDYPRATLVGDARFVTERYARDVYNVDFDFLWPRLLVAMRAEKADDPMLETIDTARSKVDFAVISLALATSIPAVWLPVILLSSGSPLLFLAIGAATPPALGFFYELVFEGQLAFGEVVKTAIDRSRFLVLKMLHQPEPMSRSEERALWTRIAQAEEDGRSTDLVYVAATTATPGGR